MLTMKWNVESDLLLFTIYFNSKSWHIQDTLCVGIGYYRFNTFTPKLFKYSFQLFYVIHMYY